MDDDGHFLLPVGTVTLLLADVEGSTRSWELAEEDMATAMETLSATVDECVGRNHGVRPLEQGEGDVGPAVNRTGRVRDAGHRGQVLLSHATAELVADRLPEGCSLLDSAVIEETWPGRRRSCSWCTTTCAAEPEGATDSQRLEATN